MVIVTSNKLARDVTRNSYGVDPLRLGLEQRVEETLVLPTPPAHEGLVWKPCVLPWPIVSNVYRDRGETAPPGTSGE